MKGYCRVEVLESRSQRSVPVLWSDNIDQAGNLLELIVSKEQHNSFYVRIRWKDFYLSGLAFWSVTLKWFVTSYNLWKNSYKPRWWEWRRRAWWQQVFENWSSLLPHQQDSSILDWQVGDVFQVIPVASFIENVQALVPEFWERGNLRKTSFYLEEELQYLGTDSDGLTFFKVEGIPILELPYWSACFLLKNVTLQSRVPDSTQLRIDQAQLGYGSVLNTIRG